MDRPAHRLRAFAHGEPAWRLTRLLRSRAGHSRRRSAPLLRLVEHLADRLRADGVPVQGYAPTVSDLDVWDLLAAERIPVEYPGAQFFDLAAWFDDPRPGRRTLTALAAHPAFRDPFPRECLTLMGSHTFGADRGGELHPNLLALALSVPGVAAALDAEVDAVTAHAAAEPDAARRRALRRLEPLRSPAGYAAFGPYLDRVAALDAGFAALPGEPAPAAVSVHAHDHHIRNGLFRLVAQNRRFREQLIEDPRASSGYGTISYLATLPAALRNPGTAQQRHWRKSGFRVPGWTQVLPGLGAVALRAGLATTPEPERAALAALLLAIADAGLADDTAGLTVVTVVLEGEEAPDPAVDLGCPADLAEGIMSTIGLSCDRIIVAGTMPAHDRYQVVERVPLGGWGDTATVRRFLALLGERGPIAWRPQWVPAAVAAGLDLPADAASALLDGGRNLGPCNRWKGEARTAPPEVADLPPERLLQLLNAAMPADPERWWTAGPDVAALARAWRSAPPDPPFDLISWLMLR
ncbi:hypothetical protein ACQP00_25115 [Dactylosporangium sp. CS-047395]|uniref:hypothetical protein n=1 Tax=Dactylosporangium sp. CS-047395 TaxID=3239936 RepID=UPI003D8FC374